MSKTSFDLLQHNHPDLINVADIGAKQVHHIFPMLS